MELIMRRAKKKKKKKLIMRTLTCLRISFAPASPPQQRTPRPPPLPESSPPDVFAGDSLPSMTPARPFLRKSRLTASFLYCKLRTNRDRKLHNEEPGVATNAYNNHTEIYRENMRSN